MACIRAKLRFKIIKELRARFLIVVLGPQTLQRGDVQAQGGDVISMMIMDTPILGVLLPELVELPLRGGQAALEIRGAADLLAERLDPGLERGGRVVGVGGGGTPMPERHAQARK